MHKQAIERFIFVRMKSHMFDIKIKNAKLTAGMFIMQIKYFE